jgi:hypothetical protein
MNCLRPKLTSIHPSSIGINHACGEPYITPNEYEYEKGNSIGYFHLPFDYNRRTDYDDGSRHVVDVCTFTRNSNESIQEEYGLHMSSHGTLFKEICSYLKDLKKYQDKVILSKRRFHKCGASHTSMIHAHISSIKEPDLFPFDLLPSTLDPSHMSPRVTNIILGFRHSLNGSCVPLPLLEYLLALDPKILEMIDIFVTGNNFDESFNLIPDPYIISATELIEKLRRYPISLTSQDGFDDIDCRVNNLFKSMYKEWFAKLSPYGIGRSDTGGTGEIPPDQLLYTIKGAITQATFKTVKDKYHNQIYHERWRKLSQITPLWPEQKFTDTVMTGFTQKEDRYILNWVRKNPPECQQTGKKKSSVSWDLFMLQVCYLEKEERISANHRSQRNIYLRGTALIANFNKFHPKEKIKFADFGSIQKKFIQEIVHCSHRKEPLEEGTDEEPDIATVELQDQEVHDKMPTAKKNKTDVSSKNKKTDEESESDEGSERDSDEGD